MKWKKVSEELPKSGQKVLAIGTLQRANGHGNAIRDTFVVTYTQSQQMIKNGKVFNNWSFPTMTYGNMIHLVSYWMPLPKMPKEIEGK